MNSKVFLIVCLLIVACFAVSSVSARSKVKRCLRPLRIGSCKGAIRRWHYNHVTNTCVPFIYSGCGGNKNNFGTQLACYKACRGV